MLCADRSNRGRLTMSVQEYAVRQRDNLWEVWLGDKLVTRQPTQMQALNIAEALPHAAAARGERARMLAGEIDGRPIEFPAFEPRVSRRPTSRKEKRPYNRS